jgi:environmental stress-induced protein Ves
VGAALMRAQPLRRADYRRMRWKNGGGWTTELAVSPQPGADTFDWRVSIAEIESDGAFSTFPNCDRYIALLDGVGMRLTFDAFEDVELRERLRFVPFAGEWQTFGKLINGPVRDFNLIVRRTAMRAEVWHRPLVGPMVFFAERDVSWFIYVAAGTASIKNRSDAAALESGDSLLLEADAVSENIVLTGGGELVIVKLTRVTAAASPSAPTGIS